MSQPVLFVTDIYDALGDIVRALGGPKAVGEVLKPHKPIDEAAGWVKDCLNRTRREKFSPDQVLWLMARGREAGCHSAITFICEQCGYEIPAPKEPETELAKLLREYITLEGKRQVMQPKIEELRAKLRAA